KKKKKSLGTSKIPLKKKKEKMSSAGKEEVKRPFIKRVHFYPRRDWVFIHGKGLLPGRAVIFSPRRKDYPDAPELEHHDARLPLEGVLSSCGTMFRFTMPGDAAYTRSIVCVAHKMWSNCLRLDWPRDLADQTKKKEELQAEVEAKEEKSIELK